MSKLHFLKPINLDEVRSLGKREGIIKDFAMERSINLVWAPAGAGKTSFCFALANAFTKCKQEVGYIDTDNGVDLLQDRGYDRMIESIGKSFKYINADSLDNPRQEIIEILDTIKHHAKKGLYDNCVFFFDSLKFFLNGGIYDESKIDKFVEFAKSIRRCGGSVWILNHSLKNGSDMKGGQSLTDAVDEQWELSGLGINDTHAHYVLRPKKKRMKVKEVGFTVMLETLEMTELDPVIASMSDAEREFCDKAVAELAKEALPQGDLLARLGKEKADRTALDWLDKHTGRFWQHSKKGKTKIYEKI